MNKQQDNVAQAVAETSGVLFELMEQMTQKIQRGEEVDVEAYAREYPHLAEPLKKVSVTLQALGDLARSSAAGSASYDQAQMPATNVAAGILGDYRILREIGRGGMGVVYEAEQVSLGRRVALKVLPFAAVMDQRQLARFKNEAHAAACLQHQNIVPVYSVGCERGVHYYAMQYVEGQSLDHVIRDLREKEQQAKNLAKTGSPPVGRGSPDPALPTNVPRTGSVTDHPGPVHPIPPIPRAATR
jgi:hypothetical protein